MSKQIYEDALADAKQIRAIAEDHAKRAIIDEVTPRIRELIDQQLMGEAVDAPEQEDLMLDAPGADKSGDEQPMSTLPHGRSGEASGNMYGMEPMPGKSDDQHEGEGVYELSLECVDKLVPVFKSTNEAVDKEFELQLYKMGDKIGLLKRMAARRVRPQSLEGKITETIAKIENMYEYVRDTMKSPETKKLLENKLESYFKELMIIRENKMSKKTRLSESDVNFKVTGLPDDAADAIRSALSDPEQSETVGVDIEVGEEGEEEGAPEGGEDLADMGGEDDLGDIGGGEEGGDEGGEDLGGFGGAPEGGEEDDDDIAEGDGMDDNTVVEIDEGMLRREIKRMRAVNEEKKWPSEILSDFGGGKSEGDPWLDGEVTTEGEDLELEGEEELEEGDDMGTSTPAAPTTEALKRRVDFEKRNIARISQRMTAIKEAAKKNNGKKEGVAQLREAWNNANQRLATAKTRLEKYSKLLVAEAKKGAKTIQSGTSRKPAESAAMNELRTKLAEQNLNNAKLTYTNKLLQTEGLTAKQKAQIIKSLDEARSLREVKLLYENLARAMVQPQTTIKEGASRVIGSGSKATKPGSTALNESVGEAERWARLAGINK